MTRTWTCRRKISGAPCRHQNPTRKRKCQACGGLKPARRRPAHMRALDAPYADYVLLNGGDFCGVCGRAPVPGGRRLDRDHDHDTGSPRGLLCHRCNRALPAWMTPDWLRAAIGYLTRSAS